MMAGENSSSSSSSYLWVLGYDTIFAMSLEKLLQLGKDSGKINWKSITTPPSDFFVGSLPKSLLRPIIYDSKIFLACATPRSKSDFTNNVYQLSLQQDSCSSNLLLRVSEASPDSIPTLPVNVHGNPHFATDEGKLYVIEEGAFWVLDPNFGRWQSLDSPHSIGNRSLLCLNYTTWTQHDGKKQFLRAADSSCGQSLVYFFDSKIGKWSEINVDDMLPEIFPISVAAPVGADQMIAVALVSSRSYFDKPGLRARAMLLDCKDMSVLCSQSLDELYEGVEFPFVDVITVEGTIVDLGNGLVCVLVSGSLVHSPREVALSVLVFSLSSKLDLTAAPPYSDQKFLDVKLHANRLFYMPRDTQEDMSDMLKHAFISCFPPNIHDDDHAYSKGTRSPPRKQMKLAS